jgi:iron(III) transport system permease protein
VSLQPEHDYQIRSRLGEAADPRWIPLYVTLGFLVIFLATVVALFAGTTLFGIGEETGITLAQIQEVLFNVETAIIIRDTIAIGIGAGAISAAIGAIYAWLVIRTDMPGARLFRIIVILPLSMPFIVKGIGWIAVLNPQFGVVNVFFRETFGFILFDIYSIWGIIFAIGFGGLPLAFLITEPAVRSIDPSLEESSRIAGRGLLGTFVRVTLPLLFPAMFSTFMLVMIFSLGNFDYPFLLGASQGGIDTLATEIFAVIRGTPIPKYNVAGIYSLVYVLIAFIAITIYWLTTRKSYKYQTVSGGSRQTVHNLGQWKYLAIAICLTLWGLSFVAPFLGMLFMSLTPRIGAMFSLQFTLANYAELFSIPSLTDVVVNTLVAGFAAGLLTAILATFIAYTSLKYDRFTGLGDYVSTIPLGFPPIVYGLAIFWLVLLLPGVSATYGTIIPLVLALVFTRLPHGTRMITSNLIQISDELEEASSISGASWTTTFQKVIVPLIKGGVTNAFLYSFIGSMRELGAVVLLITAGNNVLTNLLLQMYSQDASALPTVAAGSMMLFLMILVFVLFYEFIGAGKYNARM